ncbi:MAG TPA: universal stress protein [Longimicrobium sp.]|nr:universal stress protein [Longimicrobium sp.]
MPNHAHTIVAGVGEISPDDPALRAAAQVAHAAGAELHLVYAYQLPGLMKRAQGLEHGLPEGVARYERGLLQSLEAAARSLPGGAGAACHVVLGAAAPTLARVAAEVGAELLVVGAARKSRLGSAILGTTAERVLREASIPVLVARRPMTLPPARVLLTTDLSELSAAVHEAALDTIDLFLGAPGEVRSLLVVGWTAAPAPLSAGALGRAARAELEAFLDARGHVAPHVEPAVRTGIPADEIVGEARGWGADLLVVGTHARGWGARLMLGSVAEASLRDAPCNVLAIPPVPVAAAVAAPAASWSESPELKQWLDAAS